MIPNWIIAIFTIVLAIATLWLVYETKMAGRKAEKEKSKEEGEKVSADADSDFDAE